MAKTPGQWLLWVLDWLGRIQTVEYIKSVGLGAALSGVSYILSAPPYLVFALFIAGCCLALGSTLAWQIYKERQLVSYGEDTSASERHQRTAGESSVIDKKGLPQIAQSEKPIIVNITPKDLMNLFQGHTEIQGQQLVAAWIGKWIKVSGPVNNVTFHQSPSLEHVFLYVSVKSHPELIMGFKKEWRNHLSVLIPGQAITVLGQINEVHHNKCHLENCELQDV